MRATHKPKLFKGEPVHTTVRCRCGTEWRAHLKLKRGDGSFFYQLSELCPKCGPDTDVRRSWSDPEVWCLR